VRSIIATAKRNTCLGIVIFTGLCACLEAAPVRIETELEMAKLANDFVSVEFDLGHLAFTIRDSRNGEALLEQAVIETRMEEGAKLAVHHQEDVSDGMGKGRRLVLALSDYGLYRYATHFRSGLPPQRLFSFTLYEDHPALVLGFGLATPNYYSMRLRDATVLGGGRLFGGKSIGNLQTLNGSAGMDVTLVANELDRISCNSLMLTGMVDGKRRSAVWGGLGNSAFAKIATLKKGVPGLVAEDPIGVLVDEGENFLSGDTFYLDLTGSDPFEALEGYGKAMRAANNASPHVYESPILCGWSVSNISKLPNVNNSAMLVQEADFANACGMTKYTKPMLRLEPDKYHFDTEQGWWDDEHLRTFKHLVPPYETFASWCAALEERGCFGYTYMQLGMPSDDFVRAHSDWMLFNDASEVDRRAPGFENKRNKHNHHQPYVTYDYTDEGFSKHFVKVWSDIRKAGVRGVKVDYPATAWRPEGGFDDRYASTNSAYRRAFELLRQAMGKDGLIDERNLGESGRPCLDVTAGVVDTQRTWGDGNTFEPEMVSRSGLRWYKNRTVFNYYSDTKAVHGLAAESLQALITLNFITSGRLDLATSYSLFTPEITRIVSRSYPHYPDAISARPLDAFTGVLDPQVYELELTPDWRQVSFYNTGKDKAVISTALSGDRAGNAIGLDPDASYHAYEFWTDTYLGELKGTAQLQRELAPGHCAMISLRKVQPHPQVISTDRHLLQGWVDLAEVQWDGGEMTLSGTAKVIGGEPFRIAIAGNGVDLKEVTVSTGKATLKPHSASGDLRILTIESPQSGDVRWSVRPAGNPR
jgi:hypothetical protein